MLVVSAVAWSNIVLHNLELSDDFLFSVFYRNAESTLKYFSAGGTFSISCLLQEVQVPGDCNCVIETIAPSAV